MGRSGQRKQQQQQQAPPQQSRAGRRSCHVSTMLDVCLTCLKGEEWCFAIGEVGHVAPDQPPPWQDYGNGVASCPLPEEGERECPEPKRGGKVRRETQACGRT
ncbi:UNVERIFIED_CONTAM: hypothetical protein FKN15_006508 [Acipenser sinensis]